MVLGIVSIVLASSCGIGGLLGIAGIVQGRKVRNEIDAQPGRYAGRSMASAGIITGTIGVVLGALVTIIVIFAFAHRGGRLTSPAEGATRPRPPAPTARNRPTTSSSPSTRSAPAGSD